MARRRLRDPRNLVHVSRDHVSGELVREVRDAVWHAVTRALAAIENAQLRMPPADGSAPRYALVKGAIWLLEGYAEFGSDYPLVPKRLLEPLASVAREYAALDVAGRSRFAADMQQRLARMLPHVDGPLVNANQSEAA